MRVLRFLALGVGSLLAIVVLAFAVLQTAPGQRAAASLISRATSGPDGGLDVVGLSGFFPADLHIEHVVYRDREGPWLKADNVYLRWSFISLLRGPLQVETLSAERVEVVRPPLPDKAKAGGEGSGRPELPIGVELRALVIDDLHLPKTLLPFESHWKVAGNATAPADLSKGRVVLNAERIDGPAGRLAADIRFDAGRPTVDGEVTLSEKRGGLVAALLERPDIEDLSMRLVARGDAQAGNAELTVSAGEAARATGQATWQPRDGATGVTVRLEAAAPGLPQGRWQDAVRGPIVFKADAVIDDKTVTVSEATLSGGPLGLEASARYDRVADRLEATATVRSDEPGALGPFTAGATWRGLRVQAKADIAALATKPRGTIALVGSAEDLSLTALDARVPPIGGVTFQAALDVSDGKLTVTSLDLGSALATVKGGGSYLPATQTGEAKVTIALPKLEPLSALAGTPLAGRATIDLAAATDPEGAKLTWKGTVNDLGAAGLPTELITAVINLSGAATWRYDESWSLTDVRVASEGATFGVAGRGRGSTGDLDLSLDLPKLGALQSDLSGSARLAGNIKLRGEGADLRLTAELSDIKQGQLVARRLSLSASGAAETTGAVRATIAANGDVAGQPLSLEGRVERDAAGGVVVPTLQGRWASVVLDVADLAVTAARTSGYGHLRVERLQDLSALAGTELGGSIDAEVTADDRATNGRVTLRLQGTDLRSGTFGIGTLDFRGTVDEPMTIGTTTATLTANRIAGVAEINRLNATATGDRKALVVALQASGPRTSANLTAKAELAGDDLVIGLTRFEGRHMGIPLSLAAPTRFHVAGERVAIEPTSLLLGGGRMSVRGTLAPTASDLQVELAALPLSLIDAVAPGTNLDGTLQAKLHMTGSTSAPVIEATYSASGLRLRRPEAALLPPLSVQGSASVLGRQATIDARLGTGGATSLALKGKATLPRGAAPVAGSASIVGTIDVAPFAPLLGNDIRNVSGTLRPNLTLEVAGSRITGNGTIEFANGTVALPESGLRLSGGEGRLGLQGDVLQVQRLVFRTGGNGTLDVGGTMRLDPQQGLMPDLTVTSRNALLVSRPDLVATVSSNLKVTGSTAGGIDITGPVTIDRAEIAIGAQQSADYPTLDVREINKPGAPKAAVAPVQAAPPPRTPPPPGATPIRLALQIRAPQAVFVRGRGLDAEMSGQLEVRGSPAAPTVTGGLTLRRGEFTLAARRLTFKRGVVTLDNVDRIDPRLDFIASTSVQSTTINVEIGGTARAPTLTVTSVPYLPPDEAMAMLLFGKPASGLSPFELAQAAGGLAELTGRSPGTGVLSRLRSGLGLDRLSVGSGSGAKSEVGLEAGRYVAPGVYVGARQGATGNSSRGVVQFEVLDHVKIEGDMGADSKGRVGVKVEWDY